jgi:hypothetical protein
VLANRVSTELGTDATLLSVVVRDSDAARAAVIANAVAGQLQAFAPPADVPGEDERRQLLEQFDQAITTIQARILQLLRIEARTPEEDAELAAAEGRLTTTTAARNSIADAIPGASPSALTLVESATPSTSPVGIGRTLVVGVAGAIGIALAIGFAYVRDAWRRPTVPARTVATGLKPSDSDADGEGIAAHRGQR